MRFLITLGALALAACGGSNADPAEKPSPLFTQLAWKPAPEDSQFAMIASDRPAADGDVLSEGYGYRCWKHAGRYDCLGTHFLGNLSGRTIWAWRFRSDALPASPEKAEDLKSRSGYGCHYATAQSLFSEAISGDSGATLASNTQLPISRDGPWSAAYVAKFIRDNGVTGAAHFDCYRLLRLVADASDEAFRTTSVTYAGFMD